MQKDCNLTIIFDKILFKGFIKTYIVFIFNEGAVGSFFIVMKGYIDQFTGYLVKKNK